MDEDDLSGFIFERNCLSMVNEIVKMCQWMIIEIHLLVLYNHFIGKAHLADLNTFLFFIIFHVFKISFEV